MAAHGGLDTVPEVPVRPERNNRKLVVAGSCAVRLRGHTAMTVLRDVALIDVIMR